MEVEKKLSIICEKIYNKTYRYRDRCALFFFYLVYPKRTKTYFKDYFIKEDDKIKELRSILKKLEKEKEPAVPKFKSGDSVYLLVKDHDNKPYTIYSIYINKNNKIGYTYIDEDEEVSNYIYPETLFVYRNTGRFDIDKTSFNDLVNDLQSKNESWVNWKTSFLIKPDHYLKNGLIC